MTHIPYLSSDAIATAIVAAARLEGEDPEAVVRGVYGSRARWYALAALGTAFPDADRRALARGVGFRGERVRDGNAELMRVTRRAKWWRSESVEDVFAALQEAFAWRPACESPYDIPRFLAPRPRGRINTTAAICGDPEPGRSALAQRGQA